MFDYVVQFVWWFIWTPFYIQIACMLFAVCLVIVPLIGRLKFEDMMAMLSLAGVVFVLIS